MHQQVAEPIVSPRRVALDHHREQHLVQLIGQLQHDIGKPLRHRPDRHRSGRQHHRDEDGIGRVVGAGGQILHQHVDAESAHLTHPAPADQRRPDVQRREHAVGVEPIGKKSGEPGERRGRDQVDQSAAGEHDYQVDHGNGYRHRERDRRIHILALKAIDHSAETTEGKPDRELRGNQHHDDRPGAGAGRVELKPLADVPSDAGHHRERNHAHSGEQEDRRAGDLVDRLDVSLRPVAGDEALHRDPVAQVEMGK